MQVSKKKSLYNKINIMFAGCQPPNSYKDSQQFITYELLYPIYLNLKDITQARNFLKKIQQERGPNKQNPFPQIHKRIQQTIKRAKQNKIPEAFARRKIADYKCLLNQLKFINRHEKDLATLENAIYQAISDVLNFAVQYEPDSVSKAPKLISSIKFIHESQMKAAGIKENIEVSYKLIDQIENKYHKDQALVHQFAEHSVKTFSILHQELKKFQQDKIKQGRQKPFTKPKVEKNRRQMQDQYGRHHFGYKGNHHKESMGMDQEDNSD